MEGDIYQQCEYYLCLSHSTGYWVVSGGALRHGHIEGHGVAEISPDRLGSSLFVSALGELRMRAVGKHHSKGRCLLHNGIVHDGIDCGHSMMTLPHKRVLHRKCLPPPLPSHPPVQP
jgi:hypothetical protein